MGQPTPPGGSRGGSALRKLALREANESWTIMKEEEQMGPGAHPTRSPEQSEVDASSALRARTPSHQWSPKKEDIDSFTSNQHHHGELQG